MLRAERVSVAYGNTVAVREVSFRAAEGEWWMIVGPNGAGKSTLAGAISRGLPYSGEVFLNEREIKSYSSRDFARKVGMLSQKHGSVYGFTVNEVVMLGRYAWRTGYFRESDPRGEESVRQALEQTGLTGMENRSMLSLSGGEAQRVFLAQTLAQDPRLLILDEPANHLDLPFQRQFFGMIEQWLLEPGRTVIMVTHDLTVARRFGTHALLMHQGRCVGAGKAGDVLTPDNLRAVYGMDVCDYMRESLRVWE